MVQGAKHMKSNNAADNGGSSPQPELQPKPQSKPKRRRKRLPRWADRLITIVIILIGVGLNDPAASWTGSRPRACSTDQHCVQYRGRALRRGTRAHPVAGSLL
ncbi:MAG: hypothetical protein ACLTXI_00810 [Collinsella sp.]